MNECPICLLSVYNCNCEAPEESEYFNPKEEN